jgi:hypothetical protein
MQSELLRLLREQAVLLRLNHHWLVLTGGILDGKTHGKMVILWENPWENHGKMVINHWLVLWNHGIFFMTFH